MSKFTTHDNLKYWCESADDWLRYAKEDQERMDRAGYLDAKKSFRRAVDKIHFYLGELPAKERWAFMACFPIKWIRG